MSYSAQHLAETRSIVEQLTAGEATVTELAAPYAISLPAISRQPGMSAAILISFHFG